MKAGFRNEKGEPIGQNKIENTSPMLKTLPMLVCDGQLVAMGEDQVKKYKERHDWESEGVKEGRLKIRFGGNNGI